MRSDFQFQNEQRNCEQEQEYACGGDGQDTECGQADKDKN
jgi:hypothetical protein